MEWGSINESTVKERILVYKKVARIFRQIVALYAESKQIHWMRSESLSGGAHSGALTKKGRASTELCHCVSKQLLFLSSAAVAK